MLVIKNVIANVINFGFCFGLLQQKLERSWCWWAPPPHPHHLDPIPLPNPFILWEHQQWVPPIQPSHRTIPTFLLPQVNNIQPTHHWNVFGVVHFHGSLPKGQKTNTPNTFLCICMFVYVPGAVQSYTWSLTYTVTTSGGSPPETGPQLSCMRGGPTVHTPSPAHRMPVYPHRDEHGWANFFFFGCKLVVFCMKNLPLFKKSFLKVYWQL